MSRYSRVHYMDNLRAFAMLLGVFFHAAIAYGPMLHDIWPVAEHDNAAWVDVIFFFTHTFRMPLFFIIAGFFVAMMINKNGVGSMIKNRFKRILLPFVIFLPLIFVSFALIFGWAIENIENKSPMLGVIAMMAQMPDAPKPPLGTVHLWFLYHLIFFCGLTAIVVKFIRFDWATRLFNCPKLLILIGPLLLTPPLMTQYAPFPAPEQFVPQLWSFSFFGVLFLFGYGLFKHETILDLLRPYLPIFIGGSILAYGVFYTLLPTGVSMQQAMEHSMQAPGLTIEQTFLALLQAIPAFFMSLFLLIVSKILFNKQSATGRKIANSSYWIYIIHLPLLWFIQFLLLDVDYPLIVEFLMSSVGTILIGYVSYILLVKHTPIGWLLNGKKKPNTEQSNAVTAK